MSRKNTSQKPPNGRVASAATPKTPTTAQARTPTPTPTQASGLKVKTDPAETATKQGDDTTSRAIMPITPRSPSPVDHIDLPPPNPAIAQDMEAADHLLSTMKQLLATLGTTMNTLGVQTIKVATLPLAISTIHEISALKEELEAQHERHERKIDDLRVLVSEQVKTRLSESLKEKAKEIVSEIISREIAQKVRSQLQEQISKETRDDLIAYKKQIAKVKINLYNTEARRHNALIREGSPSEPLRPLLRPFQAPTAPSTTGPAQPSTQVHSGKRKPSSSVSSQSGQPPSLAINTGGIGGLMSSLEIELLTPPSQFPRDLTSLTRLREDEVMALLRDYGIGVAQVKNPGKGPVGARPEATGKNLKEIDGGSREDALNQFLSYIGVGIKFLPMTPAQGNSAFPHSPLIARVGE